MSELTVPIDTPPTTFTEKMKRFFQDTNKALLASVGFFLSALVVCGILFLVVLEVTYALGANAHNGSIHKQGDGWAWYCVGQCIDDTPANPSAGYVIMGGGEDVDAAFKWMISQADGGDLVVLRTDGTDAYNDYIYSMGSIASVSTLIISSPTGANSEVVSKVLERADAVFIAGGDQFSYVSVWNGTSVQHILNDEKIGHVVVGGTSAGAMVQGEYIFTAQYDSVTSAQVLSNPFSPNVTIGTDFFHNSMLQDIIIDTHFFQRDRMGRLVGFVARLITAQNQPVPDEILGIGCDQSTAILVDAQGHGSLVNQANSDAHGCYFVLGRTDPSVCQPGSPLSFTNIQVFKAVPNQSKFDFVDWVGSGGTSYILTVNAGVMTSSQNGGSIY